MHRSAMALAWTLGAMALTPMARHADAQAPAKPRTGHFETNGVNYYYEIHGRGEPLLVLHGGLGSISMFEPDVAQLAKSREVIAVDLHGHGRTTLGTRPITHVGNGDDLAALVRKLGYASVDVMGYSFGGGAALRLAIQHPQLVRRMVIISAPYAQDGFYA